MIAAQRVSGLARTASTVASVTGGDLVGADTHFAQVVTDSRAVAEGDCFVALRGPKYDGHDYVADAAERGAACAVVARRMEVSLPQVVVNDPLLALQAFARTWREQFDLPVVGITGSNGKTTLRALCEAVLAPMGNVMATRGNLNNHIGVPLMLCRLEAAHDVAVLEMGANRVGEIAMLAGLVQPRIGVVSNAGDAHLAGFGSRDGVAKGKGELFAALPADGVAIVNVDDAYAEYWLRICAPRPVLRFGLSDGADVRASDIHSVPEAAPEGSTFTLHLPQQAPAEAMVPLPGLHNVRNALAAATVGHALGLSVSDIVDGLARTQAPEGRLRWLRLEGGVRLIDDSYNANPDSLQAGIALLQASEGCRVLVLGDMAELGADSEELHARAGREARAAGIARLYALGGQARHAAASFGDNGVAFDRHDELASALQRDVGTDWVVLVKGSRAARMEQLIAALSSKGNN